MTIATFGLVTLLAGATAQAPAPPVDPLLTAIKIGNELRIEESAGTVTRGRLITISPEALTLDTGSAERRIRRDTIDSVAVKRSYAGWGALIGFGAGAALGYVLDQQHHDADLPALLGAAGGAVVGRFIPRMKVVCRGGCAVAVTVPVR